MMKKCLIYTLILSLLLVGCGTSTSTETQNSTETQTATETQTVKEKEVKGKQKIGNWIINVNGKYSFKDRLTDNMNRYDAEKGSQFMLVSVSVKNTGKKSEMFLTNYPDAEDIQAKILYADDYEYSMADFITPLNTLIMGSEIDPLITKNGYIAFSVPDAVAKSKKPIRLVFSVENKDLVYRLR